MSKAYGYGRVSHPNSVDNGLSIPVQETACKHYFNFLAGLEQYAGVEWGGFYADLAVSAFKQRFTSRPQGEVLNLTLRAGDHLIFPKLDRGFRSVRDLLRQIDDWQKRGIRVHFADIQIDTSTAVGNMIMQVLGVVAEWLSRTISERTRAGLARRRDRAVLNLGVPRDGRKQIKVNGEVVGYKISHVTYARIKLAYDMRQEGFSLRQIGEAIEALAARQDGRKPKAYPWHEWSHHFVVTRLIRSAEKILQRQAEQRAKLEAQLEQHDTSRRTG